MTFCPLNNAHLPCDKNCALWIQEEHICTWVILALAAKDMRDHFKMGAELNEAAV